MTKSEKSSNNKKRNLVAKELGLAQLSEILTNKKKFYTTNLKVGFLQGFGGLIGVVVAVLIISILVNIFGGAPIIGDFLHKISEATNSR